jgi:hypothetical protein
LQKDNPGGESLPKIRSALVPKKAPEPQPGGSKFFHISNISPRHYLVSELLENCEANEKPVRQWSEILERAMWGYF